ncbi:predicted protein [Histoplasma capsulatum H143]|uniref:Uncharacterized protein n=1 Tax=Ajellomyces capsulatus (strain H143) TaxID=544712 RepID=C6HR05_AJECH|nr:predicted protein [Histoplasma capsulatum H143]
MAAAQQAGGAPPSGYPGGPPPVGGAPRPGAYPGQTQQYQAYPGPQAAVPPPAVSKSPFSAWNQVPRASLAV